MKQNKVFNIFTWCGCGHLECLFLFSLHENTTLIYRCRLCTAKTHRTSWQCMHVETRWLAGFPHVAYGGCTTSPTKWRWTLVRTSWVFLKEPQRRTGWGGGGGGRGRSQAEGYREAKSSHPPLLSKVLLPEFSSSPCSCVSSSAAPMWQQGGRCWSSSPRGMTTTRVFWGQ